MELTQKSKFNVGDTVILKSGGPPMTIKAASGSTYLDDMQYSCCWFNQNEQNFSLQEAIFSGATLKLIGEESF